MDILLALLTDGGRVLLAHKSGRVSSFKTNVLVAPSRKAVPEKTRGTIFRKRSWTWLSRGSYRGTMWQLRDIRDCCAW